MVGLKTLKITTPWHRGLLNLYVKYPQKIDSRFPKIFFSHKNTKGDLKLNMVEWFFF